MKKLLFFFMPVIALSALPATSLYPQRENRLSYPPPEGEHWSKLAEKMISPSQENDDMAIEGPGALYTAIKLKVVRGGINLHRCVVWFSDGEKKSFDMRNDIPAGGESRVITLGDKGRSVTRFVYWYDVLNYDSQKAGLELWARP
jgi:hypothetical protein